MMIVIDFSFSIALVASLWLVIAQPLDLVQYNALMDVYTGLGCNETICPRFPLSSNCTGAMIDLRCGGGNVTRLDLFNKPLTGSISSSIGLLTALTRLRLYNNQLNGPITSHIGQLTTLTILSLENNQLTGAIPTQVGQLTALNILVLSANQLTGSIPTHVGQLKALASLYLSNNRLTGTIATQIGQLTALHTLALNNNQLTGSIPPLSSRISFCNLQQSDISTFADANCLDCSTAPTRCNCDSRTCPPTSLPSTTTTQQASSSMTTSSSGTSTLSTMGTTIQVETSLGESSANTTTTAPTLVIAVPTQAPDNNIALIGGIVGGVVALLLIIALIAFIVTRRSRRRKAENTQPSNRNDVSMAPAQASSSNYGKVNAKPASNDYDESFLKHTPAYDVVGVLTNNNYGIANANQTNYDDPSVLH